MSLEHSISRISTMMWSRRMERRRIFRRRVLQKGNQVCVFSHNTCHNKFRRHFSLQTLPYDSWQIKNILAPGVADPHGTWHNCKIDINKCSPSQLQTMQEPDQKSKRNAGVLLASEMMMFHIWCDFQETWLRSDSPVLNNKSIAKVVGDWYYDRHPFQNIDCPYPCHKTCHNRIFDPHENPSE
ncbi:Pectin acetylesterase 8 [Abeliophyllum distichum]|uniref:Pectin acetylesterase n=1 Tax=Abeliophyllum distichum TaxID=126358 RepID=A0ABD1NW43_9LAMI